jgi:hypothetical protein
LPAPDGKNPAMAALEDLLTFTLGEDAAIRATEKLKPFAT